MKRFHVLLADHARLVVKLTVLLTVLAFAFAQIGSAALTTLFVATNLNGDGSTWATATNSIQGAIDAIDKGNPTNTVWVSNGVYEVDGVTNWPAGMVLTNRIAITNAITVRSANNNPTNTIIRGAWDTDGISNCGPDAVRCVYMANGSSLIGFMLTNGASMTGVNADVVDTYAGGVWSQSTNTVISNCVIAGNRSYFLGAGAYKGTLYNCTLIGNAVRPIDTGGGGGACNSTLYNCSVISNYAYYGGGARGCILYNCTLIDNGGAGNTLGGGVMDGTLYNCTLIGNKGDYGGGTFAGTLINCTLISNIVLSIGGGAYGGSILSNCTLIGNSTRYGGGADGSSLYNCLLIGNSASDGGGGGARNCTLYNCTVANNNSASIGGGMSGGISINSIIYFNTATTSGSNWYGTVVFTNSCTSSNQVDWVPGNITGNPMFVDTNTANYRLSKGSPCINTGTNMNWMINAVDLDGRVRIRYGVVDMGAYENIYEGTIYTVH